MNQPVVRLTRRLVVAFALAVAAVSTASADTFDEIGLTQLRQLDPTLTGAGVVVAQPEGTSFTNGVDNNDFEVNPATVGQPTLQFTYTNSAGDVATTFPNAVGTESAHANSVGSIFYGSNGVAPGVSHVENFNANFFLNNVIATGEPLAARVVNQSFIASGATQVQQQQINQAYDNYIAFYGTIIVSAVGNGGTVNPPGTSYNGIGVAAYGGASSVGPNFDGRSKPDITAPASATSFSTPLVSGAATILYQAGARGDGGSGTATAAVDSRTVKALLLNGAVKPADWVHTPTAPLDPRYGAGVLNVYNSYVTLAGGAHAATSTNNSDIPQVGGDSIGALQGWDFSSLTSGTVTDAVNHYRFDLTSSNAVTFTLTSTLVWNRQFGQVDINNLDLLLYDATTGLLVDSSVSTVDNVEHLFTRDLPPGIYDLQVVKRSDLAGATVSDAEVYALAFDIAAVPEPGTYVLLIAGAAILWIGRRVRRA